MKTEKSLSLFSDETLDSMTMAMFYGGDQANNCYGGNCVQGCGGSGNNNAVACGSSINSANAGLKCNCGNQPTIK